MKDTGSKIKQKVRGLSGMPKVIYMLESSRQIKHVDLVYTLTSMAAGTKVNG